jgi:folate-binding protein YgfZ
MNIIINSRPYTVFSSLSDELLLANDKNYLFDLEYLGCMLLEGERAREFLQGQISCDVREVNPNTMRQGVMCNLQGRILAALDVIEHGGLYLILPKDILAATQKNLAKPALLSRVNVQPSESFKLLGLYLQNPNDITPWELPLPQDQLDVAFNEHGVIYNLGNNLYVVMATTQSVKMLQSQFLSCQQLKGSFAWHALKLKHKHIEIYPETRGLFLPHRLDFHLSRYLSFAKGCYKGQEIIARTHYRAKLKHQLKIFHVEDSPHLKSGDCLFKPNTEVEVGEIIDFTPLKEREFLVAVSILTDHPNEVQLSQQQILTLC